MIKHVGKHDQKKCVLLFKDVPGYDDMCLIVYTDTLPKLLHDPMMKCIESEVGQRANDITGPLNRTLMDNGKNLLNTLHTSGYITRVPTNQMILMPQAGTTIRLDELNKILKEMEKGEEATQRLAELDAQAGIRDPAKSLSKLAKISPGEEARTAREAEEARAGITPITASQDTVLTDTTIAQGQISQANALAADAERLLTEANNLRDEAYTLAPELKPKVTRKKRTVTKKVTTVKARKPGRPKKNAKTTVKS